MGDPHYPRSDQEHSGSVHEPPILQEIGLLRPLPSDLSSQCRDAGLWSKSHNSVDRFCGSSKRRPSVELSCELGLGVGENPRRVCRICYRHFSSGRALGGHMRVHGPLFQSAGTKRKMNPMEFGQGPSNGIHMDCSDSKGSELSLLSRNLSDEQAYMFEGIEEPIITSDSDCEAVDDAETSDPYLHQNSGVRGSSEHRMSVAGRTKHACMELDAADDAMTMASSKRNPLYTLRHNPKKSSRFVEEELSMGMFLAEQDAVAAHPLSKGSAFTSLERPRVCSVCGKSFWSWKALFGHMRCHPERQWRGITPPDDSFKPEERIRLAKSKMLFAESRLMESSDFELDSDAENEEFGREEAPYQIKKSSALFNAEQVPDHDSEGDDRFDENSKDAESFGDTLREDDGHRRWPTGKRSRRKYVEGKSEGVLHQADSSPQREEPALTSESGSVEETEQQHEETPNFLLMLVEAARTIEREAQVRQRQDLLQRPRYDFKHYGEGQQAVVAISSSKQPEAAAANAVGMANKYECSTCKKSFNSHQALGGHRASHRKMKGCFARNGVGDNIEEYNLIRDDLWQRHAYPYPSGDTDVKQQPKKEHECSICHRIFSTGQALGGHKRCHYIGEKATEAAASFTSSSSKHRISENGCFNRLDAEGGSPLDLNMPAPTEENGENADVSLRSLLFDDNLDEKSKQQSSEELTLAPWAARKDTIAGGQIQSSPWELGSSWTRGPAVAC